MLKTLKKLCTPAYVYLVISAVSILAMIVQNAGNTNKYCIGKYECDVPNTTLVFVGKILYVALWTFVLNWLCKSGYKQVSWFLVLLPFVLYFVVVGALMVMSLEKKLKHKY